MAARLSQKKKSIIRKNKRRPALLPRLNPFLITIVFTATVIFYIFIYALERNTDKNLTIDRLVNRDNIRFKYNGKKKVNYYEQSTQQFISDRKITDPGSSETLADFFAKHRRSFNHPEKNEPADATVISYRNKHPEFYKLIRNLNQKNYLPAYRLFKKLPAAQGKQLLKKEFSLKKNDPALLANLAIFAGSCYHSGEISFLKKLLETSAHKTVSYYLSAAIYRLEHPRDLDPNEIRAYFNTPEEQVK